MKTCPNCESIFNCEATQSSNCWCMNLPALLEPNSELNCFCPSCLAKAIGSDIDKKLNGKTQGQMLEFARRFQKNGGFVEYIDYTIENGKYIFTKWYHLKRGECCDNGCKNCPY